MNDLFSKWTSMLNDASGGLLTSLAVASVVALLVVVLMSVVAGNYMKRAEHTKTIVTILVFCGVAACAVALVNWAIS